MPLFGLDPVTHQGDRITGPLTGDLVHRFRAADVHASRRIIRRNSRFARRCARDWPNCRQTLGELPKQRSMAAFLLANMIYTDGLVSLFAFGGIYAAGTFGWQTIQIGTFGIILAIAGTFGAWLGGKLDDRLGPKRVIAGSMRDPAVRDHRDPAGRQGFDFLRQGRAARAGRPPCSRARPNAPISCWDA